MYIPLFWIRNLILAQHGSSGNECPEKQHCLEHYGSFCVKGSVWSIFNSSWLVCNCLPSKTNFMVISLLDLTGMAHIVEVVQINFAGPRCTKQQILLTPSLCVFCLKCGLVGNFMIITAIDKNADAEETSAQYQSELLKPLSCAHCVFHGTSNFCRTGKINYNLFPALVGKNRRTFSTLCSHESIIY